MYRIPKKSDRYTYNFLQGTLSLAKNLKRLTHKLASRHHDTQCIRPILYLFKPHEASCTRKLKMSTFNLSADAPEFIPGSARGVHGSSSAGAEFVPSFAASANASGTNVAAPAAAVPVDVAKRLTIDVLGGARPKRTLTMHAMAEPRTDSLTRGHGPFNSIGSVFHGYSHDSDADSLASDDEGVEVGCHDNDYRVKTIVRPIPGVAALDAGTFPNNISEYYWINDGKNDEHPWYVLGRLNNGAYFYFIASCNFSGFECEGQMALYLAPNLQTLYDNGMCAAARLRFASCFDKATREKLKADVAAARAQQAAVRVAAAKARQAAVAAVARKPNAGAGGGGAGKRK